MKAKVVCWDGEEEWTVVDTDFAGVSKAPLDLMIEFGAGWANDFPGDIVMLVEAS